MINIESEALNGHVSAIAVESISQRRQLQNNALKVSVIVKVKMPQIVALSR